MRASLILSTLLVTFAAAAPVADAGDAAEVQEFDWKPTLAGNKQPSSGSLTDADDGIDPADSQAGANFLESSTGVPTSQAKQANRAAAKVTNPRAFDSGAGNRNNDNVNDGGNGQDTYTFYRGPASNFPAKNRWISFDKMFNGYKPQMRKGCTNNRWGPDDTESQINDIREGIQSVAKASLVDHRLILAVIMQESVGCVHVPTTTSPGAAVRNPGLMQSHNGATFNPNRQKESIRQMIQDGTQGTASGAGLVQGINQSGNVYAAARIYNSGSIAPSGDLSNGNGATPCYVSDIANRLTGWVNAKSRCAAR